MPEPPQFLISDDVCQVQSAGKEDHKAKNPRPGRHQTGGIQTSRAAQKAHSHHVPGDFFPGDVQKMPNGQIKVDGVGDEKAYKIPSDAVDRQQEEQHGNIQGAGKNIKPHGPLLLPQALGQGVGNGIAVEHGNQRGKQPQQGSGGIIVI